MNTSFLLDLTLGRPEALNLPNDPMRNMAFDFAITFVVSPIPGPRYMIPEWPPPLGLGRHEARWAIHIYEGTPSKALTAPLPDDEEYDPKARSKTQKKKRVASEAMPPPSSEIGRQNLHTLPEDHSYIFSNSVDLSFSGGVGFAVPSSQVDAYGFDDNLFGAPGIAVDGPDIADELARELGEGWGGDQAIGYVDEANQAEGNRSGMGEDILTQAANGLDMDIDMYGDLQYADPAVVELPEPSALSREKVSGITVAQRTPPETRPLVH